MTTTSEDAKSYLANKNIPALFESLMTGLMYNRPTDHITYLQECLGAIKEEGVEGIRWNAFIQLELSQKLKTPLPPIPAKDAGKTASSTSIPTEMNELVEETGDVQDGVAQIKRITPLPPIGQTTQAANTSVYNIPQCPIVFVFGGPGSGKHTQIKRLLRRYEGWVHLSMGDILRQEIADNGTATEKWSMIVNLVNKGELAPQDVALDLLGNNMAKQQTAAGIIVEGFPRTMDQVQLYANNIGRVDLVMMIDCEEQACTKRLINRLKDAGQSQENLTAIANRIARFKTCLPVAKHYDDQQKVAVIEGDKSADAVFFDICSVFEHVFYNPSVPVPLGGSIKFPKPPPLSRPSSPGKRPRSRGKSSQGRPVSSLDKIEKIQVVSKDAGRKPGIPPCPIFFLMGGPGSGKGTHAARLVARYPGFVHLSMGDILRTYVTEKGTADDKWSMIGSLLQQGEMAPGDVTADLLVNSLKKHPDATAFIIEGYPRTKDQVEQFNDSVGGLSMAILLDCDEYYMQQRLTDRQAAQNRIDDNLKAIAKRISFFKYSTLPVAHYFDTEGKLVVVNGDRDIEEIFFELCSLFDYISKAQETTADQTAEVIEAAVAPETAPVVGDNGNPYHSKELDSIDDTVDCWVEEVTYQQAQYIQVVNQTIDLRQWLKNRMLATMENWLEVVSRVKVSYTCYEYQRVSRIPIYCLTNVPREEIIKMMEKTVSFIDGSSTSASSSKRIAEGKSSVHVDMSRMSSGSSKELGGVSASYSPIHATLSDQDLQNPEEDSTITINVRRSNSSYMGEFEHEYEVSRVHSDDEVFDRKPQPSKVSSRPSHLHHSHMESSRQDLKAMSRQLARLDSPIVSNSSVEKSSLKSGPVSLSASYSIARKPTKSNQSHKTASHQPLSSGGGEVSLHATLSNENCTSGELDQTDSYTGCEGKILRSFHSDGFIELPDEEKAREAGYEVKSKFSDKLILDVMHVQSTQHEHRPTHIHEKDTEKRLVHLLELEKASVAMSLSMGAMHLYEEQYARTQLKLKGEEWKKHPSRRLFQTFRIGEESGDMDSEQFYSSFRKHYNRVFMGGQDKYCKKSVMKIRDVINVVSFASVDAEIFVPTFSIQMIETPSTLYIIEGEKPSPGIRDVQLDTALNMENFQLPDNTDFLPDHKSATFKVTRIGSKDRDQANLDMKEISDRTIVFVVGGPGSGKGTQCKKIAARYGFCHLSSGDLLRQEVQSGSELGKELTKIMESGALVPIETVLTLLKKAMLNNSTAKGFLVDGYPREVDQGKLFENEVKPCDFVLYFEVSDDSLVQRLLKRAETSGRADDNEETIKKRLATFHEKTQPLVDHYAAQDKTKKVPSEGTIDEIFGEVEKLFESLGIKGIDTDQLKDHDIMFVLGGPGSGKGTQCRKIMEKYGLTHLSSGDLLRQEMASGSSRGEKLREIMEKGELVPVDAVLELLKEAMVAKADSCKGFIIDGYPRQVDQAERFEEEVKPAKHVLFFDLSEDSMKTRLADRAQASDRVDDSEEIIQKRMATFNNLTKPTVEHFTQKEKLIKINAEGNIEEVFNEVEGQLEGKL